MGIRVTKVLGYGLTDVKTRKGYIADGRINAKSPLLDYESDVTFDEYLDWLVGRPKRVDHRDFNIDSWINGERKKEGFDWYKTTGEFEPRGLIHHGTEYMEKNVLLIRPLSFKDWKRYDDAIDYIEETVLRSQSEDFPSNHYEMLPDGIYPFSGSYMNANTGERVSQDMELRRCFTWKNWDKLYDVDRLAQDCGFTCKEDARVNLVPTVPCEVRDLVEWGKLFKNDGVWKQLRPMLYTYWS